MLLNLVALAAIGVLAVASATHVEGGPLLTHVAFKQLIYRNDEGDLIVTISQNSIGNAITELLGVVVKRVPDAEAYEKAEPALIAKLLEVRDRLIKADLGDGIETPYWSA